jgi:hypothetical protein
MDALAAAGIAGCVLDPAAAGIAGYVGCAVVLSRDGQTERVSYIPHIGRLISDCHKRLHYRDLERFLMRKARAVSLLHRPSRRMIRL